MNNRTKTVLDKINDEFYRPRGLYALVLTWNPDDGAIHETLNINNNILSRTSNGTGSSKSSLAKKLSMSSGMTSGNFEFPETAPLIFLALDDIAKIDEKGQEKTKKMAFVADYLDRRARASYVRSPYSLRGLVMDLE